MQCVPKKKKHYAKLKPFPRIRKTCLGDNWQGNNFPRLKNCAPDVKEADVYGNVANTDKQKAIILN